MSQSIFSAINPDTTSGLMLAGLLDDFKDAVVSGFAGTSRPPNLQAGGYWIDTSDQVSPDFYWAFKLYTGVVDVEVFRLSINSGFGGTLIADAMFEVSHVSADTVGPILELIKQRVLSNGQVLSGDAVGEIRWRGMTATGTAPVLAYMRFTAAEDETSSASGGTLTFTSTTVGTNTITGFMQFITGLLETVAPHKLNSLQMPATNVATTATLELAATSVVDLLTGSTATNLVGVDSTGKTKIKVIHNKSTAIVTLKHESTSATLAADRMYLPGTADIPLNPDCTASFFYSVAQSRWKLRSLITTKKSKTVVRLDTYALQNWTAPTGITRIRLTPFQSAGRNIGEGEFIDAFGNRYSWGVNLSGEVGNGNATNQNTPQQALGLIRWGNNSFSRRIGSGTTSIGLDFKGKAYCWGGVVQGSTGLGDVTIRSSPVAVLGNYTFTKAASSSVGLSYGLTPNGTLYSWGANFKGGLGLGDIVHRSSPVAVLGGLKFCQVEASESRNQCYGLTFGGDVYGWGDSTTSYLLGDGSLLAKSSPVAILSGLNIKKIFYRDDVNTGTKFALDSSGVMWAWGQQGPPAGVGLSTGPLPVTFSPTAIVGNPGLVEIFGTSRDHGTQNFGRTADGTLYGWGYNSNGEVGDGTSGPFGSVTDKSSPVLVLGGIKFKKIIIANNSGGTSGSAVDSSIYGLALDGTCYAWGCNAGSCLGLGDAVSRSSPVAILGGLKFADIKDMSMNQSPTIWGITEDESVYVWGNSAQPGDGTTNKYSSPVLIVGLNLPVKPVPMDTFEFVVTGGTTYQLVLGNAQCKFAGYPIGVGVDFVNLEYEQ